MKLAVYHEYVHTWRFFIHRGCNKMFGNDVYLLQPAVKPNEENSYSLEHNKGEALQNRSTSQYMDARGEGE